MVAAKLVPLCVEKLMEERHSELKVLQYKSCSLARV